MTGRVYFEDLGVGVWIILKWTWNKEVKWIHLKVKCSRYRLGVAQRVGRGIALLFHDRGTRRGWVVNSTPRPHFTPGKDPVPVLQEAGWAPGPVWTSGKSRPHRDSIPYCPARSQSLYRLSYPTHEMTSSVSVYESVASSWECSKRILGVTTRKREFFIFTAMRVLNLLKRIFLVLKGWNSLPWTYF